MKMSFWPFKKKNKAKKEKKENNSSMKSTEVSEVQQSNKQEDLILQQKLKKMNQFENILSKDVIDIDKLKKLLWNGVPLLPDLQKTQQVRTLCWQCLLGYLPLNKERRGFIHDKKRMEYIDQIERYFNLNKNTELEQEIRKQIEKDITRTRPDQPLFQLQAVQDMLRRILYIWSVRHPASGYVQGINDLATPFIACFIQAVQPNFQLIVEGKFEVNFLNIEADVYWCLERLLSQIQDFYIPSTPGIQRAVLSIEEVVRRIDVSLYMHFQNNEVQPLQYAFR